MWRQEKQRRKELLHEVKRKEMAAAFAALPIPNSEFQTLFDRLDAKLPTDGCDHSRSLTIAHIRERFLPEHAVLQWFDNNGGVCDCEVLATSTQAWEACKNFDREL